MPQPVRRAGAVCFLWGFPSQAWKVVRPCCRAKCSRSSTPALQLWPQASGEAAGQAELSLPSSLQGQGWNLLQRYLLLHVGPFAPSDVFLKLTQFPFGALARTCSESELRVSYSSQRCLGGIAREEVVEQCRLLSVFVLNQHYRKREGKDLPPRLLYESTIWLLRPRGSQAETNADDLQGCHCGNVSCQTDSEKVGWLMLYGSSHCENCYADWH